MDVRDGRTLFFTVDVMLGIYLANITYVCKVELPYVMDVHKYCTFVTQFLAVSEITKIEIALIM